MREPLLAIDLFCGLGAASEGLRQAGFKILAAVDIDRHACDVYSLNHIETTIFNRDLRSLALSPLDFGIVACDLDVLIACPPCQGYSLLRTRNSAVSKRDPRNSLCDEIHPLIDRFRPKFVIVENVPSFGRSAANTRLLRALRNFGYHVSASVIDAKDFGVPQRRKRFVLMGTTIRGLPKNLLNELERVVSPTTVRDAFKSLSKLKRDPLHNSACLKHRPSPLVMDRIKSVAQNGGNLTNKDSRLALPSHKDFSGYRDVYGRMSLDSVAPTITGGVYSPSKGRFLHPTLDRMITLREAATLQSIPITYEFPEGIGRVKTAELIGNAFPSRLAKLLGEMVRRFSA